MAISKATSANALFARAVTLLFFMLVLAPSAFAIRAFAQVQTAQQAVPTCSDGADNDGDGRIDWNGGTLKNGKPAPPDPSCPNANSSEVPDKPIAGGLVPCVNKCDLSSVLHLLNNLITFLIKTVMFPLAIVMFIYTGYTYIISQGEPAKRVQVKKLIKHLILGMLLMLTAWLIVKTLLTTIGYKDTLYFFSN